MAFYVLLYFILSSSGLWDAYLDARICNEIQTVNRVELGYDIMKGTEYFMSL